MLLEKRAVRRIAVDVALFDLDLLLRQKTPGVAAGGSRRLEVEDRLGHGGIVRLPRRTMVGRLIAMAKLAMSTKSPNVLAFANFAVFAIFAIDRDRAC
jgi:hypothetical protein